MITLATTLQRKKKKVEVVKGQTQKSNRCDLSNDSRSKRRTDRSPKVLSTGIVIESGYYNHHHRSVVVISKIDSISRSIC